jgi:hypothetical protein
MNNLRYYVVLQEIQAASNGYSKERNVSATQGPSKVLAPAPVVTSIVRATLIPLQM